MASETDIPSREPIDQCTRDIYKPMALRAALQLDLFSKLADGALTGRELANALGVGQRRLEMLLYQLVLSEFLHHEDGRFSNSAISDLYLVKGRPEYTGGIHQSWTNQWYALLKTAEGIREDRPQLKVDFDAMSTDQLENFLRGLQGTTIASGRALASRFDFSKTHTLLDIGGGSGGLSIALCNAYSGMTATIVELPKVASIAKEFVAEAELQGRIEVQTADVVAQPLRGDFDVAVARAFFQVLSEDKARIAMQHVAAGIAKGGHLHIIGFVSDDSRLGPETAVGMNVVFINQYDEGGVYTEGQYREWMTEAGLTDFTRRPFIAGNSLISARKA